jgi:hypothetical protein
MRIIPLVSLTVIISCSSFFVLCQSLPPGIANRNIHWPKDGPMGPQVFGSGSFNPNQTDQEKSGEDWWYDVKPIYETGIQTGYMTCGFTAHKNYYFNEYTLTPKGFIVPPIDTLKDPCDRRTIQGEYVSQYEQHIGRYDLNGNPLWCKHINLGGPLLSLINTPDGGFVAVGETFAAYNHDTVPFIYNPTASANTPITSLINPIGTANSYAYGIHTRINVVKFDVNGQVEWNYIYGIADLIPATNPSEFALNSLNFYNQELYGLDIDVTQNQDGYVVMGSNYDSIPALYRMFLMRLDLNGLLQTKATHGPADDSYQAWVRAMDCEGGACFITGQLNTDSMGPIPGGETRPGFLLKINEIDLNLSASWGTTWGLSNPKRFAPNPIKSYMLQDVIANPDGSVVSASINESDACWYGGSHENNGIGAIVKFNSSGNVLNFTEFGEVRAFDMKVGLTKLADGGYAVVSSKRTKDINGMDIIPNWNNPPYNTIMADFFNQAGYPAGEGCYTWDSLPNMLNGVWNTDTYIAKFNANLSLLWETQFDSDDKAPINHPGDFKKQECMYRIAEGADGSLVAVGNSSHNIDDYLFVKVFSDCQSLANYEIKDIADNTITIVGNQTWNTNSTLIGKVVIPNGQSLTISNSTIQFADSRRVTIDTRIVIEPGGKLIINNATLTSLQSCENAMWDGIEIQGNPTMSQIPNSNQGYLSVVNSIISNSRNAVSTVARDTNFSINWSNTGGGIVKASNSQFINNYRTFEFMKYHPLNTAGNPTIDLSSISSCLFSTNDTFGDGGTIINPYAQITMWDTRNIRVSGNIFENLRLNISEINRGIGIVAIDAAFAIKPGCNAPIISASGCLEVNQIKNEFHNLYTGISTSGVTSASFTIDNALFTNNLYGIRIEGAQFGEIIRSTFNVPFSAVPGETKYGFGIYADAASAIKIEGNVFDGLYNTTGRSIGVFMNNSDVIGGGVSNYRNDYLNLSIGTQVAGSNTTLEIDCNRFYKQTSVSFADIHVATGILANQGVCNTPINPDPTLPQANEFYGLCNNTSFNQLRNTSSASFEYNSYPQADVGFDTSCLNGNILGMACQTSITYARDSACPSTITTIGGSVDKLVKIEEDKSQITFLQNKVDGGNSLEIQQLIANSIDANNLKSQLDSIEPYLSQQNQLAVINKNMPGVIKKQILEDNAAFKPDVCNGIVNSTMSNAVKNQLMAIAYGESPLDRLDKLIHHYENELRLASNDLMKVYLDSNYMDSTSFALSERISIERTKLMIPILVQKDSVSALNYLALVQNYADSILLTQPEEAQELVRFHDFYSNILTIVNRPSGYFNLSTIELQTIKDIANEIGPMASHANSILNFIDKKLPYVDAYDLNGTKSTKVYTEQEKWFPLPEELPKITVFPNPSTGIFEIRFEEKNNAIISVEVYNLEGRLLFEENALTKNMNIDLSNLNSGIYILKVQTFLNESEVYYTERIVISN